MSDELWKLKTHFSCFQFLKLITHGIFVNNFTFVVPQSEPYMWKCSFSCSLQQLLQLVISDFSKTEQSSLIKKLHSYPFLISLPSPPHTAVHQSDVSHTAPPCHRPTSFSGVSQLFPKVFFTNLLYSLRYFACPPSNQLKWPYEACFSVFFVPLFFLCFVRSRVFASDLNHYPVDADQNHGC